MDLRYEPSHLRPPQTLVVENSCQLLLNLSFKRRDSIVRLKSRGCQTSRGTQSNCLNSGTGRAEKCPTEYNARGTGSAEIDRRMHDVNASVIKGSK